MTSRPPHDTNSLQHQELSKLFEQLFLLTKDRLYHFTWKLTRDPSIAKDIIQDCYLKLWQRIHTIDTTEDVLPLLFTYARNGVIDNLRKLATSEQYSRQQQLNESETAVVIPRWMETEEEVLNLKLSIGQLPTRRKEIFTLVKEEGLSYKEVAAQLRISVATVEKQMGLSMKFLRDTLKG
ncbi:sigma-70 family RNA polymerase sigma factor [Pseudoflavitalea sp. G-6-1-2]|uniref:sigma-70 family RNA polymerase sigma factor n=1 Tax=Pseudoflavitalea sp. G-6-1-2 TaxID=2728841 RepID=UPI00146F432D|nr:sigma-70 family RNA polymerase sigma factor [Pseudoflavitalea sp. G-6-1-2]NML22408.1 sigma-70 family RNA polymerase sigma factor [Pseudoflavitalea sp. G-6-1-2]